VDDKLDNEEYTDEMLTIHHGTSPLTPSTEPRGGLCGLMTQNFEKDQSCEWPRHSEAP
jgi:hypothetical protein